LKEGEMMNKNKNRIVLFLLALLLSLCTTTGVMAFNDEPCTGVNYEYCASPADESHSAGNWHAKLRSITETDTGLYEWTYEFKNPSGVFTGANFVAFLIPDCCNTDDVITISNTNVTNLFSYPVAAGEGTIYFGRYNNQAYVVKGTPDNSGIWKFTVNTMTKTRSTIIIKAGKDVEQFEMAVPGCPIAPQVTTAGVRISSTERVCINIQTPGFTDRSISLYRQTDGYVVPNSILFWSELDCSGTGTYVEGADAPAHICTGGTESKVNECIQAVEGSQCYNYYSCPGGKCTLYTFCY
jgi:hypothetical protein